MAEAKEPKAQKLEDSKRKTAAKAAKQEASSKKQGKKDADSIKTATDTDNIAAEQAPEAEVAGVIAEKAEINNEALAKAGKRSAKAQAEAEAKAKKASRKAAQSTEALSEGGKVAKAKPNPPRPRSERHGKQYKQVYKLVEKGKKYSLKDAMDLATKTAVGKFDNSVEIHVNLGVDPRQADQNVRATVGLPNGTGKTVRVAVFAPDDTHAAAKKAGADVIGEDDFLKQLDKELINFDVLISTPQLMPKLGKYARFLGPRGLMPNPKSGTVTPNIEKAVKEAKAGRVEYRVDKQSIVHLSIGKVSFGPDKLHQNAKAFFDSLQSVKPTSLKSSYIEAVAVTTTMGPGIKVDLSNL